MEQKKEENTVIELVEREIQNIVVLTDEQTEACCSWQVNDQKPNQEKVAVITKILTESEELVTSTPNPSAVVQDCQHDHLNEQSSIIHPSGLDLPSEDSSPSSNSVEISLQNPGPMLPNEPPAYMVNAGNDPSASSRRTFRVSLANCTLIPSTHRRDPMIGPPPSYSKSLLDRRINACASIQFVAPIPPPSYDGTDHELRYAHLPGFTLGMGSKQCYPLFCGDK